MIPGVDGFMYPNEVELQWSLLIVLYPYITGLVAGAFILASLERVFKVDAVRPTYRLALLTALGFVWSRSAITRRTVEYDLQQQLAGYFQAQNNPQRAAIHAAKAAALKAGGARKSP